MSKTRRPDTAEFELAAAQLVTEQGRSLREAARSLGVSEPLPVPSAGASIRCSGAGPSISGRTFEARRLFEDLLPVVPSAGVLIEF